MSLTAPCLMLLVLTAAAQQPLPQHSTPAPGSSPAAVAVPDTGVGVIELSAGAVAPVAWQAAPDTIMFGGIVRLALDFPADTVDFPELKAASGQDWLVPVPRPEPSRLERLLGRDAKQAADWSDRGDTESPRRVWEFRVYRTDPFILQSGNWTSSVIPVRGRAAGVEQTATIRGPRSLGWPFWTLLGLSILVVLIVVGLWYVWGLRSRGLDLPDISPRQPAWLLAVLDLEKLLEDGLLAKGDPRGFMDRLAGIVRSYTAGHFRIAALEMTGTEIIKACADLAHPGLPARAMAGLINEADKRRYDPQPPPNGWCLEQAGLFFDLVKESRVEPRLVAIAPDVQVSAEKAWSRVGRELAAMLGTAKGKV